MRGSFRLNVAPNGSKCHGISFFQTCFGKMIKLPDFMGFV
jgi:hypothetical protein